MGFGHAHGGKEPAKKRALPHVPVRDATNIAYIAKRRMGRDSRHKIAYFIHRSICGAANIQIYIVPWPHRGCG